MRQVMSNRTAALLGIAAIVIGVVMLMFLQPTGHPDAYRSGRFYWSAAGFILIGIVILLLAARDALRHRRGKNGGLR